MGNSAGQSSQGLHPLRLAKTLFGLTQGLLQPGSFRNLPGAIEQQDAIATLYRKEMNVSEGPDGGLDLRQYGFGAVQRHQTFQEIGLFRDAFILAQALEAVAGQVATPGDQPPLRIAD